MEQYTGQDFATKVPRRSLGEKILNKTNKLGKLFLFCVAVPTIIAIIYFGFLASDVYVSESRFVVRSPERTATSSLGLLLKSAGFANAGQEVYAAHDYLISRDAMRAIDTRGAFRRSYSADSISVFDRFGSFWTGGSTEKLYKYYRKKVTVGFDASSSIVTLTVRAYSAADARRFNEGLLQMAEATVNRLNARGRQDMIRFASVEVENAKQRARAASGALSSYRNRERLVDPERQAAVQLQMISKLQDELIASRTQLVELQKIAPANSQVDVLRTRVASLTEEIAAQLGQVAGAKGSLSSSTPEYTRLTLESQFADRQVASAMASLEDANNEARRKQAYVERIAQPNLPDEALEPRRLRLILATFVMGLLAWGILSLLLAGVKEHQS